MPIDFEQLLEIPDLDKNSYRPEIRQLIDLNARTNDLLTAVAANQKQQAELIEHLLTHVMRPAPTRNANAQTN